MDDTVLAKLNAEIQQLIDLIATQDYPNAVVQYQIAAGLVDKYNDTASLDRDLIAISRYQVLLQQLHQKIAVATQDL